MKYSTIAFIASIMLGTILVHAQTISKQGVWVSPADAVPGADITINTLVFNNTKTDSTITVVFRAAGVDIGTTNVLVPKEIAKPASVPWVAPEVPTVVEAVATKAVTSNGKAVPELTGVIGSVRVGPVEVVEESTNPVTKVLAKVFNITEPIRTTYATYFANLRDTVKTRIGIAVGTRVGEKVTDAFLSEVPAAPIEKTDTPTEQNKFDNPIDYLTLIFASGMATLLGNQPLFYITLVLLIIMLIKFIFRLVRTKE